MDDAPADHRPLLISSPMVFVLVIHPIIDYNGTIPQKAGADMTDIQQREAARQFFYKWNGKGREDEDARSYTESIL